MNKTTTRTATIYMDENEIIHIDILPDAVMDYEDAVDQYLVMKQLLAGRKNGLKIIDSRVNWSIEKKAREYLNAKDIRDQTLARAIVTNSKIDQILMGFFINMTAGEVPTKVFNDYDEAYNWLLKQKDK